MKTSLALFTLGVAALCHAGLAPAQDASRTPEQHNSADNGTDPTRVSRAMQLKYEHLGLRQDFSSDTLKLWYTQPLGAGISAILKVPVTRVDMLGNGGFGLGDVSAQLGKVFGLNREGGHVVQGELIFDTATRPELGGNQNVFKGTYVRALFMDDGSILGPSFVHNVGVSGQADRPRVNLSTVDLYYVPKMADPRNLVTYDPNVSYNWQNRTFFASLAVTVGRNLGPSPIGGNLFVLLKPAILFGSDRPNNWGLELTYRIIGF